MAWLTAAIGLIALVIQAATFMADRREQALRLFSPIMALLFLAQVVSLAWTSWLLLTDPGSAELPFCIASATFALFVGIWLAGYANKFP